MEVSNKEKFITPTVGRREAKPSVQLRSMFVNIFGSSSKDGDKPKQMIHKTVIFGLPAYSFRFDLNTNLDVKSQNNFNNFINKGLKRRYK